MNTKNALERLSLFLGEDFLLHPRFLDELSSLIAKELKGKEERFFKILATQLSNIKNFGIMVHTVDSNEQIHGGDGHFFSIHLQQSQFNIRFLIYIRDDGKAFFLCAFYERSNKKATDYTKYTPILSSRRNYFKED